MSEDVLNEDIAKVRIAPLTFYYKNHTQGVERCLKLVTYASTAVYGFETIYSFSRTRINSRNLMALFE